MNNMKIAVQFLACLLLVLSGLYGCRSAKEAGAEDSSSYHVDSKNIPLKQAGPVSNSFSSKYAPYRDSVYQYLQKQLTFTDTSLFRNRPEGRLNNLLADMVRWYTSRVKGERVDVSFIPYNLIQDTLHKGSITTGDLYRIIPRDQSLGWYEVSGAVLSRLADTVAREGGGAVSGLRMRIVNQKARDVLVGSLPVRESSWYYLVAPAHNVCRNVSERLVNRDHFIPQTGNSPRSMIFDSESEVRSCGILPLELRDVVMEYMSNQNRLERSLDNRIR